MKKRNGAEKSYAIFLPEIGVEKDISTASTLKITGRRQAQLAGGPVHWNVRAHLHPGERKGLLTL